MLNRTQLIERYNQVVAKLDEPGHHILLSAGGALVMMGLREETDDLDLDVPEPLFRWLSTQHPVIEGLGDARIVCYADDVALHELDPHRGLACIEGVWCYSPREMLLQKKSLLAHPGRYAHKLEQDRKDIEQLEAIMPKNKFTSKVV